MRRTQQRHTAPFSRIIRFTLRLVKAIAKAFTYLTLEFAVYIAIGGLAIALVSLGVSINVALNLSLVLVVFSLVMSFLAYRQHRIIKSRPTKANSPLPVRGEVKLADWIAQTLSTKAPQEWEDYQDWLHDILLARRQLLDHGYPVWKVTGMTYWRLIGLCITVALIKLRRLALAARRLR
jgi:ABC-type transport system involved in cytochrome bd biosynthesis fused ATPase/permease subunit